MDKNLLIPAGKIKVIKGRGRSGDVTIITNSLVVAVVKPKLNSTFSEILSQKLKVQKGKSDIYYFQVYFLEMILAGNLDKKPAEILEILRENQDYGKIRNLLAHLPEDKDNIKPFFESAHSQLMKGAKINLDDQTKLLSEYLGFLITELELSLKID